MCGSRSRILMRIAQGLALVSALALTFGLDAARAVERTAVLEYFTSTT